MKAVALKENIWWVGGIDWDIRNFHGYLTPRGSTYNAYLVIDEKITLIDTVKHYLDKELLSRISSVIDPSKIDYVVVNHVEMDHSGSLPQIMAAAPNAVIVTSPGGEKGLEAHYHSQWKYVSVKSGDSLKLGKMNLDFIQTPMVHWPDNMVTYLAEEKILFSNDAFGQHIASPERFDDQLGLEILMEEASKYYANIVFPYGSQVQKALLALAALDVEIIAPSHGVIWREHIPEILKRYAKWSANETDNKAVIVYDSMYGSTEKIAYVLCKLFEAKGISARLMNLKASHISDIVPEVLTAKYVCVGSPTLNNNMMPTVAGFLTYMKGLAPKNRIGMAFGSYGWSGQSVGQVEEVLREMGFQILPQVKLNYVPTQSQLDKLNLGQE